MPVHLALFEADVTVPLGHSLCGGWIRSAAKVDTPLRGLGLVLLGDEPPVVLCALDWCGLCNYAHRRMREVLARAAHTFPERVTIHTVHQHNAPFVDLPAQDEVAKHPDLPPIFDVAWWEKVTASLGESLRQGLRHLHKVTHVSFGQAKVERVASNRRVIGPDGKIKYWRGSSCKDPKARAEPEGLIDPFLKTIGLWSGDRRLVSLHYYTTHPMSYYGDGVVNSDFVGLARDQRAGEARTPQLYFTGCAGNVAAGKYNDGSPENRPVLAQRIHAAMVAAEKTEHRLPITGYRWQVTEMHLPPRQDADADQLRAIIADRRRPVVVRNRSAMKLSYRLRAEARVPLTVSRLVLHDKVSVLHLPAEAFVEYQLYAQELVPNHFLAVAAYGDDGPWYIPLKRSFAEGGYEPSVAFAEPNSEDILRSTIASLLRSPQ